MGLAGFAAGLFYDLPDEPPFPTTTPVAGSLRADTTIRPPNTTVRARIHGAGIKNPGTYELPADSEIIDLVKRAGGLKPGAITEGIRWREKLYEGLRVTVPTHRVLQEVRSSTRPLTNEDLIRFRRYGPDDPEEDDERNLLDLNEASRAELKDLHGIGSVLSGRILDYREQHDGFDSVSEIKEIFGIGDVTYQELKAKVTVD